MEDEYQEYDYNSNETEPEFTLEHTGAGDTRPERAASFKNFANCKVKSRLHLVSIKPNLMSLNLF